MNDRDHVRRTEIRERATRDIERYRRRAPHDGFFRSIALIGSVGWPIVLLSTGGALLGRHLDQRLGTGIRFTLMLLSLGTIVGSIIAYRTLRGGGT